MAEFAPALMVVLVCFFFPMIDMLGLALSYCLCMVLNYNQVHEASLLPAQTAQAANGPVKKFVVDAWLNGMGKFVKMQGMPNTVITYRDGNANPDGQVEKHVSVSTTVQCLPFLSIPLPVFKCPGLNGPMTFTIASERPMENPDYAQ